MIDLQDKAALDTFTATRDPARACKFVVTVPTGEGCKWHRNATASLPRRNPCEATRICSSRRSTWCVEPLPPPLPGMRGRVVARRRGARPARAAAALATLAAIQATLRALGYASEIGGVAPAAHLTCEGAIVGLVRGERIVVTGVECDLGILVADVTSAPTADRDAIATLALQAMLAIQVRRAERARGADRAA